MVERTAMDTSNFGEVVVRVFVNFLVSLLILSFSFSLYAETGVKSMAIGLERAGIRARPSVLAKAKYFSKYGDKIQVLQEKGRWRKIKSGKIEGWLEKSALGSRKTILRDIGKSEAEISSAYQDEVASAAKGLSAEMEELHKKQNPELNYALVDKVESFAVSPAQMLKFSKRGKLKSKLLEDEK